MGKESGARIVLPEINDKRVQEAVTKLNLLDFEVINHADFQDNFDTYLDYINALHFTDNWPEKNLRDYLDDPLHFSMAMTACDDADGVIAGAATPSSEVIRSAIRIIGIHPNAKNVSSIFFMIAPQGDTAYTFADCAVIPEPDSKQLAAIAGDSAEFHQLLTGEEPKVAFLSFSTKGSASHYRVDRVREAVEIFAHKYPNIIHDGE
ncbi:uncharacterized protein METZ01_LOCUS494777, partial [marine metagenome]